MIRKDQRPFCFTDWQRQQLKRIDRSLRRSNRDALDGLGDIGRTALTHAQYQKRAEHVATIAIRMTSALRVRQEILACGREQEVQTILVQFAPYCEKCAEKGLLEKPDTDEGESREAWNQDPAYQKEIEDLLELALLTEESVSARCKSRRAPPRELFTAIRHLTSAVLGQQKLLRSTARKRVPDVEFIDTDTCPYCNSQPDDEPQTTD